MALYFCLFALADTLLPAFVAHRNVEVVATEKKLVQLYRDADSDTKKKVMNLLKGTSSLAGDLLDDLLDKDDLMDSILDTVQDLITSK